MDLSLRNSKEEYLRTVDINTPGCLCGAETDMLLDRCGSDPSQSTLVKTRAADTDRMTLGDGETKSQINAVTHKGQLSVKLEHGHQHQFEPDLNSGSEQTASTNPQQTVNSGLQLMTNSDSGSSVHLNNDMPDKMDLKRKCNRVRNDDNVSSKIEQQNAKSGKSQPDKNKSPGETPKFFLGTAESDQTTEGMVPNRLSSSRLSSIDEGKPLSSEDMEAEAPVFPVNVEFNSDSTVSVELPPCDCDDCQLGDQDGPAPKKGMTLLKRQSSWKIIRHIVRWSPFVQVFKKNKYPWIQLAGHQGNFQAGESGAVLKKLDNREKQCYLKLMSDTLRPYVPEYRGDTEKNGDKYIQLQDLLCEFCTPCVMDVKMGCRTYLEEELEKARSKPTLRKDMYKKMIEVDPSAPSPEEREKEGVTKARYLQWRDEMSSSVTLGFRIEGIKKSDGSSSKDFKKTKTREHVHEKLKSFIGENTNAVRQYIERLKAIRSAVEESEFFQRHEVISSSLLFVHDSEKANIWIIDFGKTEPLPSHIEIDHRREWMEGNHEDGYLAGLDRLLSIFYDLLNES